MKSKVFISLIFAVWGFGCVSSGQNAYLEQRISVLERQNAAIESTMKKTDRLATDQGKQNDHEIRRQSAELYANIESIRQELRDINGRIDEADYSIGKSQAGAGQSSSGQETRLDYLSERVAKIERHLGLDKTTTEGVKGAAEGDGKRPTTDAESKPRVESDSSKQPATDAAAKRVPDAGVKRPAAVTEPPPPADKKEQSEAELYDAAKKALDKGENETARDLFTKYLKKAPKSGDADNAQFWLGETFYRDKWYEKAIMEYQKVIENYPNGNKVPAALLKQGLSFFNLNEKSNARLLLQEVVNKYPKSNEAKIAKDKLSTFK
jgi:tol-pal system protein YbgF